MSLAVFIPKTPKNHAITYTNFASKLRSNLPPMLLFELMQNLQLSYSRFKCISTLKSNIYNYRVTGSNSPNFVKFYLKSASIFQPYFISSLLRFLCPFVEIRVFFSMFSFHWELQNVYLDEKDIFRSDFHATLV